MHSSLPTPPLALPPAPSADDEILLLTPAEEPQPARRARPTVIAPPPELPRARRVPRARRKPTPIAPLMITLGVYATMMAVSFGQIIYGLTTNSELVFQSDNQIRTQLMIETAVFEGMDTALVLAGLLIAGRTRKYPAAGNPLLTWLLSAPGFVTLLGINLAYHLSLKWLVSQYVTGPTPQYIDIGLAQGWLAVLLVCVQPAIVEELFFRYLMLGHLRPHVGLHAAVWISAVVFGIAHLGSIPGWPVLILLGAGLGYARVASGGLILPMLLHFLHNLAVLGVEYAITS
jgi:membrane protease YdiL (CAAX protease family)